jgi:hypothetical protein
MQRLASVSREEWPIGNSEFSEFEQMFANHGIEVRGKPVELDRRRLSQLNMCGRLIWIVARSDFGLPIGYQLSFWYRNLHWDEREAIDDLWFVVPSARCAGVGSKLKIIAHDELKRDGVVRVFDNIRESVHARLMGSLGFDPWGTRWVKQL